MRTEWGVADSWGTHAVSDLSSAETIVKNMSEAGHEARVIWRGVTEWQDRDTIDD